MDKLLEGGLSAVVGVIAFIIVRELVSGLTTSGWGTSEVTMKNIVASGSNSCRITGQIQGNLNPYGHGNPELSPQYAAVNVQRLEGRHPAKGDGIVRTWWKRQLVHLDVHHPSPGGRSRGCHRRPRGHEGCHALAPAATS